jgi:small subunit ribosomal protein S8
MMTDPIADMLTRIRNAILARSRVVELPASKIKARIAEILLDEGYLDDMRVREETPRGTLVLKLRYDDAQACVIEGIKRVSKPGCRVYVKADDLPKVRQGLGIAIVSTSQGVLTDRECRKRNIGGELLCTVW